MFKVIFCASLFAACSAFGQLEDARKWTKDLCAPDMHGRGYVNGGDNLAADYLVNEYAKLGLIPAPGQGNMKQGFSFSVNTFPGQMSLILDNEKLRPGIDFLVDPGSSSFHGSLNPYLLDKNNLLQFLSSSDKASLSVKGYNALLINLKDIGSDTLKQVKKELKNWSQTWPIIELYDKKFTWSVSEKQNTTPYIQLRDSLYFGQKIQLAIDAKWMEDHATNNVVAYLPAKRKTNRTIYFTAHYDHLGRMGAETYFPGANDNASGTAMLLSLAQHFKQNPSKYNLVFISFAGEEAGLIGSRYYVEHPLTQLSDIQFVVNLDIMGSGEEGITVVNSTLFPKDFKNLTKINKKKKLLVAVNPRGPAANSDHYFFTLKGIPSFFIYTQGPNKNYHDVFDTYENLSFAEYADLLELLKQFVQKK